MQNYSFLYPDFCIFGFSNWKTKDTSLNYSRNPLTSNCIQSLYGYNFYLLGNVFYLQFFERNLWFSVFPPLYFNSCIIVYYKISRIMELGHLLTRSGLTYPEVSSKVCHDSFCQLGNSVSLPWLIYYGAFYLHVVSSFSCIPVLCLKLVLFLIPLQFVHLFCNQSKCILLFSSCMCTYIYIYIYMCVCVCVCVCVFVCVFYFFLHNCDIKRTFLN